MINHVSAGKAYVDMSTVDAQTASEIGNAITEKGGRFLEAPVSGSKKPAEDGTVRNILFYYLLLVNISLFSYKLSFLLQL